MDRLGPTGLAVAISASGRLRLSLAHGGGPLAATAAHVKLAQKENKPIASNAPAQLPSWRARWRETNARWRTALGLRLSHFTRGNRWIRGQLWASTGALAASTAHLSLKLSSSLAGGASDLSYFAQEPLLWMGLGLAATAGAIGTASAVAPLRRWLRSRAPHAPFARLRLTASLTAFVAGAASLAMLSYEPSLLQGPLPVSQGWELLRDGLRLGGLASLASWTALALRAPPETTEDILYGPNGAKLPRTVASTQASYELGDEIGRGAMGVVYEATDEHGGVHAIKFLSPEVEKAGEARFARELRILMNLRGQNPHIVQVNDSGNAQTNQGPVPFLVMQRLQGQSLGELLQKPGSLPVDKVASIVEQVVSGLLVGHTVGVVHRDIKPSNLWLEPNGNVVILDFGLAKTLGAGDTLTESGTIAGTPLYMSPEQARGDRATEASDTFSLAAVIYQLVTSKTPYHEDAKNLGTLLMRAQGARVSAPAKPVLDPKSTSTIDWKELELVLRWGLAPKPQDRPPLGKFGEAVRAALDGSKLEPADREQMQKLLRENPWHVPK